MKKKRRLNYTPCKCPVWRFPHKPENRCFGRFEDFDIIKYQERRREYMDYHDGHAGRYI